MTKPKIKRKTEFILTESKWSDFAATAAPGDSIVYYRGLTPDWPRTGPWEVFKEVESRADDGEFSLTQKVVGGFPVKPVKPVKKVKLRTFEYRAEKISPRAWVAIDNLKDGPDIFSVFKKERRHD
jgi:hypothetical protein